MSLDPAMAALAARTAAAWRAEQDQAGLWEHAMERQAIERATEAISQAQTTDAPPAVTAATAHMLIPAMRVLRPELVHFAGAAHRDPAALAVCQEWQLDREASEDVLRERGRARRGGAW